MKRFAVFVSAALLISVGLASAPVGAATINAVPAADAAGPCASSCTLRQAILRASSTAGRDTIVLPAGRFVLTRVGQDDTSDAGDLDITSAITIRGAGPSRTIIQQFATTERVLHVTSAGSLVLEGATIKGGSGDDASQRGGGILNQGVAAMRRVTVSDNDAGFRGGGISNLGRMTIERSTITRNRMPSGDGGGLYNEGTLVVTDSTISDNEALKGGGAGTHSSLRLIRTSVIRNTAAFGGGVFLGGNGPLSIVDSSITHNEASGVGGGGYAGQSGLTVTNSTFAQNRAIGTSGQADAGGLFVLAQNGQVSLKNVTVSGNTATGGAGGLYVAVSSSGAFSMTNTTITRNIANIDGQLNDSTDHGGGILFANGSGGGPGFFAGSLIVGNVDYGSVGAPNESHDCYHSVATSLDGNVVGGSTAYPCIAATSYDRTRISTGDWLRPLANNGGPTQTHAIARGSIAVNRRSSSCASQDQRNAPRPSGSTCDAGAYELSFCHRGIVNVVARDGGGRLTGSRADDVILGSSASDRISAGSGNDRVCAVGGNDFVLGAAGDDRLDGGAGNDTLHGGAGRDLLIGSAGARDLCIGGPESDGFRACETARQ